MSPFTFALHLVLLLAPALMLAVWLTLMAKLLRWRQPSPAGWRMLLRHALLGSAVMLAGLFITGQDGKMATYAALVLVNAAALAWALKRKAGRA